MSQANEGMLNNIDARTQLVGHNRLELLLFRLTGKQRYGINVFKVREVVSCPEMTKLPNTHHAVKGITNLRGNTFMIVDLQHALGMPAVPEDELSTCSVIVTEYNRKIQGFLVPQIEHIVNKHWEEVLAPPKIAGKSHYLTAVTRIEEELIEILDVEKVLYEITGMWGDRPEGEMPEMGEESDVASRCHVLVADDSSVARNQLKRTLNNMGLACTVKNDGKEAWDTLNEWAESNSEEFQRLALIISDVEMPNMDGYTLTNTIRANAQFNDIKILLHTSLSGVFDSSLLDSVKADGFLSKFDSDELSTIINEQINAFAPILAQRGL